MIDIEASLLRRWKGLRIVAVSLGFGLVHGITLGFGLALVGYALIMLGVCLLACFVPARRVLKVDPIAALRTE